MIRQRLSRRVSNSGRWLAPASTRPATARGMGLTVGGGGDPANEKRMKVQTKAEGEP